MTRLAASSLASGVAPARWLALAIAIASALAVSACGSGSPGVTSAGASRTARAASAAPPSATPGVAAKPHASPRLAPRKLELKRFVDCVASARASVPGVTSGRSASSPAARRRAAQLEQLVNACRSAQPTLARPRLSAPAKPGRPKAASASHFSPRLREALQRFSACMRAHGVASYPQPNTSGHGAIFDTSRLDPTSVHFGEVRTKCDGQLQAALARPGGR